MKKFVMVLLGFIFISNYSFAKTFSDLDSTYWASSIINEWTNNGIMSGYEDGTFKPESEVTKAELVTILNKINNDNQIINKRPSKDIKLTDWYCQDMAIALKNNLVQLDNKGNLYPKSKVTCEEAITMISKLLKDKDVNIAAVVKEAFSGRNNSKINLNKNVTRAELTSILDCMIDKICTNGTIRNQNLKGNLIINGNNVFLSNVQVDGKIILLKGAKKGNVNFNNVYASKGIISDYQDVISYNDGTKPYDNLSNLEVENKESEIQFVKINYSETDWTTKSVTATLKFDDEEMEIINNKGQNKYKFYENGEFTFICVDNNGKEHRYTAKVDNIAKKDLKFELDIQDNSSNAVVTVNILQNEAPIDEIRFVKGKESSSYTLRNGQVVVENQFTITETEDYTVAIKDEAGNTAKVQFSWQNGTQHMITVVQSTGGKITPDSIGVKDKANATFSIVADKENGYYIEDVLVDGISQGVIDKYTFTAVTQPHKIEAKYKLFSYDVIVTQGENGKIEPTSTSVSFGGNQKFIVTPNKGYDIEQIIVDKGLETEQIILDKNEHEFINIREPHTITATFKIKKYTITVKNAVNGKITPETTEVSYGQNLKFAIEPDEEYQIKDILIDDISIGAILEYEFKNIDKNHTLEAIFEEIPQTGILTKGQIGEKVYVTVYDDYSCIIYGVGDTYDYVYPRDISKHPLGQYANQITTIKVNLGVTNIGDALLSGCSNLTNINISDSVKSFGRYAFADCINLTAIEIPDVMEKIEEGTFYNCKLLERIIIPDSIKEIGIDAFNGCLILETVTLPETLEEIKDRAFKNCRGIIESIDIPEGTNKIGEEAFFGCDWLTSFNIPQTVEFIGKDAFDECGNLKNITFKNRKSVSDLVEDWRPNGGEYKETTVRNNYVITRKSFEILVIQEGNGIVTPHTLNVAKNKNQKFIFTPKNGYIIEYVKIDGEVKTNISEYEFKSVNRTHTVEVKFKPIAYKIEYNLNGGQGQAPKNPEEYTIETLVKLTPPIKRGYEFMGWIQNPDDTPNLYVEFTGEIGDKKYIATWSAIIYTISYRNVTPEELEILDKDYTVEDEVQLKQLTRDGYKFKGWKNEYYTTPQIDLKINRGSIGDRYYEAVWELE